MKTRIEYCNTGLGFSWFVDALIPGLGWKNIAAAPTRSQAEKIATQAASSKAAGK